MPNKKTLFVLGAGFSQPTAPSQAQILYKVINLTKEFVYSKESDKLKRIWPQFESARNELLDFICELFHCTTNKIGDLELEDIFTILDKAINKHQNIYNLSDDKLAIKRRQLNLCIAYMFDAILYGVDTTFYNLLSKNIIKSRLAPSNIDMDNFSFINLNWDLLFDNALFRQTTLYNQDNTPKVALDYCFYTDTFRNNNTQNYPHIILKAIGKKNIKLLKPHGSFNWLVCKNCSKVFIDFSNDNKIAILEHIMYENNCEKCGKAALISVIQTPTLIKDFDNVHLADILHNIQIELLEASKIVFIGYSLPLADFDFRYILKRCIRSLPEIKIEVVLLETDNKYEEILDRYKRFFGNQINITGNEGIGSENYFSKHSIFKWL